MLVKSCHKMVIHIHNVEERHPSGASTATTTKIKQRLKNEAYYEEVKRKEDGFMDVEKSNMFYSIFSFSPIA